MLKRLSISEDRKKIQLIQDAVFLIPAMTRESVAQFSFKLNVSTTSVYNFRKGQIPTLEQYNHILDGLFKNYRVEFTKLMDMLSYTVSNTDDLEEKVNIFTK